jgi:hypothetical protein
MNAFASGQGASPYAAIGTAMGFEPVMGDTHTVVTLSALRLKTYEIQSEDPFAWAALVAWLTWLFGVNVLRENPKEDTANENAA